MPLKGEISAQAGREFDTSRLDLRAIIDPRDLRVDPTRLFLETTQQTRLAICISDPHQPDCPVVYVNQAFLDLTGYAREEIVGRNCRFLQGADTDPEQVRKLREGIAAERYTVVDLLNYRKDGIPFWNAVHVGPIYGEDGTLQYFYGSQWDITDIVAERRKAETQRRIAAELRHRTGNIFAVLNAIIGLTSRRERDVSEFADKLSERVSALASAHRMTIMDEPDQEAVAIDDLVTGVMKPYRNRFAERVTTSGPKIELGPRSVTALGLALHELATNAVKYGALSVDAGRVEISWSREDGDVTLVWQEQGGPTVSQEQSEPVKGNGTMLIDGMIASLTGSIERDFAAAGLQAKITLPVHQPE
ncbi:sensory box histidine kinase [Erythrobacter litoralis HTCC2594]|uniref:Blue-light-activated histidine kinase 1 n=1 Tax=Erythrobacter litoralis (strain HTCC2594) TaxID=314225 RepID=LVHK1_ERYLH|nr:RecName: Full=Blue-light-activated histidine kinase 1; AltName: Full=EL360-LOV-histidine kinase; Short=EL360-LOV-HK [Erythrobacter litoralis HTCC2594]ABC62688.1 sensory box histidine kinase [Erythrobacter litoralis HTCC2594]